jgi:type IV pilus assembly protein PilB
VPIGEQLIAEGVLTPEQLAEALAEQQTTGLRIGELLVNARLVSAPIVVRALSRGLGVRGCVLRHGLIDPALLEMIGEEEATRLKVIPMFKVHGTMTVAMAEPQALRTIDALSKRTGCRIRPVLALESNILEFIRKYAGGSTDIDGFLATLTDSDVEVVERETVDEGPATDLDQMVEGSPIVNLVNMALLTAVKDGASDIHIEPDRNGTRVRYRIDGVLRELMHPPAGMHAAVVSRAKVMGKMDVAEKRIPQEGRIRIVAERREIDLRVSSMPTLLGEKMVIRILDKENLSIRLEELGFRPEGLAAFQRILRQPHGIGLVTGPTGSGKTTTLYSALDLLRSPELNIITVEDPVEYQLDLINQVQVHEAIGLTFAKILRSVLRQDPDVIMVGEIRDEETARVAVQAALTGHLVLATLHTNDAPGASATKYYPAEQVLKDAGLADKGGMAFTKGAGCERCHNSGYRGRAGIYEIMEVTDDIRRLIHRASPTHELRATLREQRVLTLREEGVRLAMRGRSSLEEVLRATHVDDESEPVGTERQTGTPAAEDGRRRDVA